MAGLDVIPEAERKGKPSDLFMPWFASNISVLGISWAAWIFGFGLSFWQAVIASVTGIIVSFLVVGLIAIAGKRGSAPTLVLSRAPFGYNGNRVSAVLSWTLTVGWETFLCIMAVQATATVMGRLGFENHTLAQIISLALVVIVAAGSGILGFDMIMKVQGWITWATAILTIIYLALALPYIDWNAVSAMEAGSATAFIGAFCMILVGFGFGWINAAADYSRYLPRKASTSGVVGWTTFGSALPTVILVVFGLLLIGSNPDVGDKLGMGENGVPLTMADAIGIDPIGALTAILPTWFLIPFAIVAILGLIGGIVMDIYSSGLSLLAVGVPVSRPVATALDGTIMLVGTVLVVFFAESFIAPFTAFLITLGVIIAAWGGIMLADIILRKKNYDEPSLFTPDGVYGSVNWGAMITLVVASFIGWGLVVNLQPGLDWQGYLLGPLGLGGREGDWAWANLGVFFAFLTGLIGYVITSAGRVKAQEALPVRTMEDVA